MEPIVTVYMRTESDFKMDDFLNCEVFDRWDKPTFPGALTLLYLSSETSAKGNVTCGFPGCLRYVMTSRCGKHDARLGLKGL